MLIDLDAAKEWLKITDDATDLEVQMLIDEAEAIVIRYLKKPDHGWTPYTVPPQVRAAIRHVLHRLNDDRMGELEGGPFPAHIKSLLDLDRDPALA